MPQPPLRILIVDDNAGDRNLERIALESQPFACSIASARGLDEAMDLLAASIGAQPGQEFDLVLVDGHLDGELATVLIDHIKAHETLSHIPVIVLTGSSNHEEHEEFRSHGARLVIEKTSDIDELIAALAKLEAFLPPAS